MTVKVESYRSTNPAQCFSCQRLGHFSLHCGYQPRCVNCSGSHLAKDCKKTLDEKPSCANYKSEHTANFKRCPTFLQLNTSKIHPTPKPRPTTQEPTIIPFNTNLPTNIIPATNITTATEKPFYASKVTSNSLLLKDSLQ